MNIFIKTVIFLIPVAAIFILPTFVIFTVREDLSVSEVIQRQKNDQPVLFGFGYNDYSFIPFKKQLIKTKNPTVIALGTSKVMQIRKEFFMNPSRFVNAAGPIRTFGDLEYFIRSIPDNSDVKVILLGIDQDMLYRSYDSGIAKEEDSGVVKFTKLFVTMSRRIYFDYILHKYTFDDLIDKSKVSNNIGLLAIMYNDGYRADGSYLYGHSMQDPSRVLKVKEQIDIEASQISRAHFYEDSHAEKVFLERNIKGLSEILDLCEKKGIVVIGFTTPYPEPIYKAYKESQGRYHNMITTATERVSDLFREHKEPFFDMALTSFFGGKETSFVDRTHITDVSQLNMIIHLAERNKELNSLVDIEKLKQMLKESQGDFLSF